MKDAIANWPRSNNRSAQLIKYLAVGSSTALLDFILFTVLITAKVSILGANISAMLTATLLNFIMNRQWAFRSRGRVSRSFLLYLVLFIFNLITSTLLIQLMVKWGIYEAVAKLFSMGLITIWNFLLYRKLIFK